MIFSTLYSFLFQDENILINQIREALRPTSAESNDATPVVNADQQLMPLA